MSTERLCGHADKYYNCIECGEPCGSEGHFVEEVFTYKGKVYIIESYVEMKNPHTREWQKAVLYTQRENGKSYVREFLEFFKLFK
jgi:hypothetical protein